MTLRESLDDPVSTYTTTKFAQVETEDSVTTAAKAMQRMAVTEAVVVRKGEPIGIITERDILYKVVAKGSSPAEVKVAEAMTSPVETIEETSRVGEAINKMFKLGLRRLGVTRKGKFVGLVTQKEMVAGSLHLRVPLPELAPTKLTCPYCDEEMKDRTELSKHIDQVHVGLGLLEGDRTKW